MPLCVAWHGARPRRAAWLGFVAGATYNGIVVSWAWYFGAVAIIPFVAVLGAYWALIGAVVAWLERRSVGHPVLTATIWVVGEGILARWPLGGFSWGEIGYSFHDFAPMRSLGALGGLALISWVAVAVNATIADQWVHRGSPTRWRVRSLPAVTLLVLATAWAVAIPEPDRSGSLRYALLQGNDVNRDLTDDEFFGTAANGFENLLVEKHFALADALDGDYDLIVFPESSFPDAPNAPDLDDFPLARWPEQLAGIAREHDSYVLANGVGDAPDGRALNLNVLWDPNGAIVGEYAKRHRVPFGEWVPWRSTIERFVDAVDQIPRDFAPGTTDPLMTVRDTPIATIICFESMFGAEVRPAVADGAELIVVSTNNRSYRRSPNSRQHLAAARIRAVETGRPVLQASVSGISAVVDFDGAVLDSQPLFENGILEGVIATRTGTTVYVRFGEWVWWGSLLTVGALVIVTSIRTRRRERDALGSVDSGAV